MHHAHRQAASRRWAACGVVAWLAAALGPSALPGQESALVVEARGGLAVPVGSFATGSRPGEGTEPAASFGVDFALPGGGRLTPYVGFAQNRFGCADAGCASDGRYVATGFHGGFRIAPFPTGALIPWIRIGGVTTHVETDALGGANAGRTKLGVGGEVGAGIHIQGTSQIALNPAVRLAAVNAKLPGGSLLRMRYLVADLGLVLTF